jgi:membrane-bound lytic murein transglycosylase B
MFNPPSVSTRLLFVVLILSSLITSFMFSTQAIAVEAKTETQAQPKQPFAQWKLGLKQEMMAQGASEVLVNQLIESIKYIPRVIELDRRQPEGRMSHEEYITKVIPESKVQSARQAFKANYPLLKQAEQSTGVKSRFIVALWGKETHFGKITGNYHVPSALATLAYDGRRATFFKKELLAATKILAEGHITIDAMKGSWAGAMGNCQFMPSSFLRFAVDANSDGKKDIWSDKTDIFASMGNYLAESGWKSEGTWGRQVKLTKPFDEYAIGKKHKQSLSQWQALGVRRSDLNDLPKVDIDAYLIAPGGEKGRIYLVYNNFDVIMRWNRSHYFATGVGYLADRIGYPSIN